MRGRRKEGETRALFLHSVPLCSPAVGTPTGAADAMSEFGHLSSNPLTHTKIHTHSQWEALTPLMAVLSHTVQRREWVYGCTPDPHTPMLVPGDTGPGTTSHQHTALTGLPGGASVRWHVAVARLWVSLYRHSESPLFSLKAFHVTPDLLPPGASRTTNRTFHHPL